MVASTSCLSASSTPQAKVGNMEHGFEALGVHHGNPGVPILVLRVVGETLHLHQGRRVDAVGNGATEEQVQTARHDDRVERRIGDEVVDAATDDDLGVLPS